MTLIGATKVKDKWTLMVDSAVTIGAVITDVNNSYRPKLREIEGENVKLIIAGYGVIKDVDFVLNVLEDKISKKKFKTKNELKMFIQETLADTHRELKTLTDDPQEGFLILEPKTDTLFIADEYSVTEPQGYVDIALGSAEQQFYKSKKERDFFTAFKHAVECDSYCSFPLVSYRDGDIKTWYGWTKEEEFYKYKNEDEEPQDIFQNRYLSTAMICVGTDKTL